MKKYIKPGIGIVAGGSEWTIMTNLSDTVNNNPPLTKDAGDWDIENNADDSRFDW